LDQRNHAFRVYALLNEQTKTGEAKPLGQWKMSRINKLTPKLRKAPQPPLSYAGATADRHRAKRPPLVQPAAPDAELNPGDRVMGLADFGKPTGEFGTVEKANEDDALVKWDDLSDHPKPASDYHLKTGQRE
jgi:hypothetical protein